MQFVLTIDIGADAMSDLQDVALAVAELGESLRLHALEGDDIASVAGGDIHDANHETVGRWVFDGDAILTDEHRRAFDDAARFIRGEYEGALRLRASLEAAAKSSSTIDAIGLERDVAQQLGRADGYGMALTQVHTIARRFGLEMPL